MCSLTDNIHSDPADCAKPPPATESAEVWSLTVYTEGGETPSDVSTGAESVRLNLQPGYDNYKQWRVQHYSLFPWLQESVNMEKKTEEPHQTGVFGQLPEKNVSFSLIVCSLTP